MHHACLQKLKINLKLWCGIILVKHRFNHPLINYQSNRNANNNFRPVGQSNQYFFLGKRQNGFGCNIPVVISGITKINNLLFRSILSISKPHLPTTISTIIIFLFFSGHPSKPYQIGQVHGTETNHNNINYINKKHVRFTITAIESNPLGVGWCCSQ